MTELEQREAEAEKLWKAVKAIDDEIDRVTAQYLDPLQEKRRQASMAWNAAHEQVKLARMRAKILAEQSR
jgi:hypothetical protein